MPFSRHLASHPESQQHGQLLKSLPAVNWRAFQTHVVFTETQPAPSVKEARAVSAEHPSRCKPQTRTRRRGVSTCARGPHACTLHVGLQSPETRPRSPGRAGRGCGCIVWGKSWLTGHWQYRNELPFSGSRILERLSQDRRKENVGGTRCPV